MNKTKPMLAGAIAALFLFGCGRGEQKDERAEYAADTTANTSKSILSSNAAVEPKQSDKKFIRTADIKFQVKDVVQSTYSIENAVSRHGGFVTYTNLVSNVDSKATTPISADSSIETTIYTVTNSITLRVPNTLLDTTLKDIAKEVSYLDLRVIKADDISLKIKANEKATYRAAKTAKRMEANIDNKGKKLNDITAAEEGLEDKQQQSDESSLTNESLADQVRYSTVTIDLYQRPSIKTEVLANAKTIAAYEPPFGSKLIDSLKFGWLMLEGLVLLIMRCWFVIALIILAGFSYRKWVYKLK